MQAVTCANPALYAATVEDKKVQEIKDNLFVKAGESRSGELESFPASAAEFLYSIAQFI